MKTNDVKTKKTRRIFRRFGPTAALWAAASLGVSTAFAADAVRAILLDKEGAPTEKTLSGTFESVSPEAVVLVDADGGKTTIPADAILWTQYDGEPIEFAAVRAETENGEYAAALEKLAAISDDELVALRKSNERAAQEFDWLKAEATARDALAGADKTKLNAAARLLTAFVKNAPTHCRYFEAVELAGEVALKLGRPDAATPLFERLAASTVPTIQARGKIALGEAALDAKNFDAAQTLFNEALQAAESSAENAESVGATATFAGTNVRILARLGAARVLAERGELADAEKAFAAVLAETPNAATLLQAKIYNALGKARADAGKPKEAIVAYLHVELLYRRATAERVQALKALAELWPKTDRPERADDAKKTLRERFGVEI